MDWEAGGKVSLAPQWEHCPVWPDWLARKRIRRLQLVQRKCRNGSWRGARRQRTNS